MDNKAKYILVWRNRVMVRSRVFYKITHDFFDLLNMHYRGGGGSAIKQEKRGFSYDYREHHRYFKYREIVGQTPEEVIDKLNNLYGVQDAGIQILIENKSL